MGVLRSILVMLLLVFLHGHGFGQAKSEKASFQKEGGPVSFSKDVFPIIKRNCLPCHAEENFNPSELSLDSYDNLMAGGKHGVSIVSGKSQGSILIQKLGSKPPFGDQMPLNPKKKREQSKKSMTPEEIRTISDWIDQGAKNN